MCERCARRADGFLHTLCSRCRLGEAPANVIAAQPRTRRLVEIVRFNAQDAREFSDPLVRDAIASVFIAADLPRRYLGGVGKLAHCHPAMLTVFLQASSDACVDGAPAIHGDHPPNGPDTPRRHFINISSNCFLVVQTLWAERIQSTTDAGSLNTFGRNEIEVAPISSALLRIACLEPISKSFEEDDEAGKLDKAEEIVGVVLPTNEDPALPLNPGEEALDEPASHVAA